MKLRGRHRKVALSSEVHSLPPPLSSFPPKGPLSPSADPTPQFLLGSLLCVFCGLAQMYKDVYSPLWITQSGFHGLKHTLCSARSSHPVSSWASLRLLPSPLLRCFRMPAWHTAMAFSDWLPSLSLVFSWLVSSFSFSTNNIPLSGGITVYLSIPLLKDTLVASRFWQL